MQSPKGEPCQGFMPTCQCQETPNLPARGVARNGRSGWAEISFLGHLFLVSLTILAMGKSHGFSRVAAGTSGIFSSCDGDAHSKREFV